MSADNSNQAEEDRRRNPVESHMNCYHVPKIPPFYFADPELWFIQVEAIFRIAHIVSEDTKADTVIAALDFDAVGTLRDLLIANPRPIDMYEQIKKRLILIFGELKQTRLRRLLKGQVSTDGKPSRILNRLRCLSRGECNDAIISYIFMRFLPPDHQTILMASDTTDLDKLGSMADRIADCSKPSDKEVSDPTVCPPSLKDELKQISVLVHELCAKYKFDQSEPSSSKSRGKDSASKEGDHSIDSAPVSELCLAHRKYPDNPRTCRTWCSMYDSWKSEN